MADGDAERLAVTQVLLATNFVVLVFGHDFDVVDLSTGKIRASTRAREDAQHINDGHTGSIFSACMNSDSSLLATTADDKSVKLWDCKTWKLRAQSNAVKRVTCLVFTHTSSELLSADKFGDVHSYSVHGADLQGKLLMGHMSLITDMLVSPDDRLIITSDRDEKIRLTRLQHAYVVEGFCLGHYQFVTQLHIPKFAPHVLLSGGGDGLVILWDYLQGATLQTIDLTRLNKLPTDVNEADAASQISIDTDVMHIVSCPTTKLVVVAVERQSLLYLMRLVTPLDAKPSLDFLGIHQLEDGVYPTDIAFDEHSQLFIATDHAEKRLLTCLRLTTNSSELVAVSTESAVAPQSFFEENTHIQSLLDDGVNKTGSCFADHAPSLFKYNELRKLHAKTNWSSSHQDSAESVVVGLDASETTQAEAAAKRSKTRRDRAIEARKRHKTS